MQGTPPKVKITTVATTTVTRKMELTAEHIRAAFNLPERAKVEFVVPGGGDWSNCGIVLSKDTPVVVTWTETATDTSEDEDV